MQLSKSLLTGVIVDTAIRFNLTYLYTSIQEQTKSIQYSCRRLYRSEASNVQTSKMQTFSANLEYAIRRVRNPTRMRIQMRRIWKKGQKKRSANSEQDTRRSNIAFRIFLRQTSNRENVHPSIGFSTIDVRHRTLCS